MALLCALVVPLQSVPARGEDHIRTPKDFQRLEVALAGEMAAVFAVELDGLRGKELVVLEADRDSGRSERLSTAVYTPRGDGYARLPDSVTPLPPGVALAAMGRFRGGPGLALLTPTGVFILPWRGGAFVAQDRPTLAFHSAFAVREGSLMDGLEWVRDLNGDGLDEIMPPGFDHLSIWWQASGQVDPWGGWAMMEPMEIPAHTRLMDWSLSQRKLLAFRLPTVQVVPRGPGQWPDMVLYQGGLFRLFRLHAQDGVAHPPQLLLEVDFQPPVPFDPAKPLDPTMRLVRATDLNRDGSLDAVFLKTAASDAQFNTNTTVLVHYDVPTLARQSGGAKEGQPTTAPRPDQVFAMEGFVYPILLDMDGNHTTDLLMVNVEIGFWNAIKALIARSVSAEGAYYLMPEGKRYPVSPNVLEDYTVKFSLGRHSHQPIFAFADLNGDGRPDLMLSQTKERLGVHFGRTEGYWHTNTDLEFEDDLPARRQRVRVTDLNGDGKDDLILEYNRDDMRLMPHVRGHFTVLRSVERGTQLVEAHAPARD